VQLLHPNPNQPFERVDKDAQGREAYGYRIVDGQEEIVHIPTGKSNMRWHKPEMALDPSSCPGHKFIIIDMGKREVECLNCHWQLSFNVATDYLEKEGKGYLTIKGQTFPII